jgi:hypothetical protein
MIMSVHHTARDGTIYYLHVAKSKKGNPTYFFSTKPTGNLADSLPAGYEVYENIRGQVFLRRPPPKIFTDQEIGQVRQALNNHAEEWRYKIETKKSAIIIHEASDSFAALEQIAPLWKSAQELKDYAIRRANYMAVMRFVLVDAEKRLFLAERFCFRGSVDDWIDIGGGLGQLPMLLKKFVRHPGHESLYDLF